jgi:pimeloyl-ACP methyl ester carboxylesterase
VTARKALLVDSGAEQIGVEVCGAGPAVVLLHGAGGNRATWFQQVVDLASDHLVVVVEARGAGRSTDRAAQSGPVACAEDLETVRRELGVPAWHVVGHSLGGWTALRYAAVHPDRTLSCVVLNSVAGVFPPVAEAHWQRFTADLPARGWPEQELARPPSLTSGFCAAQPERAYLYQLVAALNPPLAPTVPSAQIRSYDLTPDELARLAMPVTFVAGTEDYIAPPVAVRDAAAVVGADYEELEDAGHLPQWEQPLRLNALLRRCFTS